MTTPVRRHRGGALQDRPLGWARNPLTEFDQLLSEMSGLVESTVAGATPAVAWTPLADVTESDDAFHVEIELPGVTSKDVNVEANGQEVAVTGEIKEKERKGVLRRSTRRTGTFEYRLRLPGEVDTEKINARMSDGVLTITVPKAEVAKPRHIEVSQTSDSTENNG
ncbi:Hsp20/alpha crystallin family protein [Streptomyces althioticus]|uniref:Hsp20/alpha crystallin family protein n=1 Tax=Streptomyces althioticus TaxID=83380 RepID=UPI0033CF274D